MTFSQLGLQTPGIRWTIPTKGALSMAGGLRVDVTMVAGWRLKG